MRHLLKRRHFLRKLKTNYFWTILFTLCFTGNSFSQNELEAMVSDTSKKLQSPIQDSVQLYKDLHRSVRLSLGQKNEEQLASSYKNLATWHNGSPTVDSTIYYLDKTAALYTVEEAALRLAEVYLLYEDAYKASTKFDKATEYAFKALEIYETTGNSLGKAKVFLRISDLVTSENDYAKGIEYAQKAIELLTNTQEYEQLAKAYQYISDCELFTDKTEEALVTINRAITILEEHNIAGLRLLSCRNSRGNILKYLERYDDAIADYSYNLKASTSSNDIRLQIASNGNLGHVNILKKDYEAAIPFLLEAVKLIKKSGNTVNLWENYLHLSEAYDNIGDFEKALKFERLLAEENKEYYRTIISRQEKELTIKYETAKKEETISEQENTIDRQRKTQLIYIGLAIVFAILLLFVFISRRNIYKKRKELVALNEKLNNQSKNLQAANENLSETLTNLKSTQAQLIQSEKMASLGELTAGIAHEIQNPLNFVNNFSEVSTELIDEMNEEIEKGDLEEAKFIANDIKQNLEKINHHGKRADAIVKGMLQHSRKSEAVKEPTDINKLADEYLRLAYHGLRAKDKNFNATLATDFDKDLDLLNVIPQDMGRVILNLINNAFYACNDKRDAFAKAGKEYTPTVSVTTKDEGETVKIIVGDNGKGMPNKILEKIFQPFFTTKPTGQGTGLGLSMSYDIVIKGHNGSLNVETTKGEGTEFIIELPK